jgi:ATP-dependent DNA helicase RecG
MRQKELLEIVNNGESSKIEFKTEAVHPNTLAEEIVAFANFEGGTILIGVDDAGDLMGYTRINLEESVVNICRNNIKPPLIPLIEKIVIEKKQILAVTIPRGDTAYATNRGLYYIRVGSTKQIPTQQELLRLFQQKNILQLDETPVIKASSGNIDNAKVNTFLAKLGQSSLDEDSDTSVIHELTNLSILVEIDHIHHPSLGGLLAFGKNPQKYFPAYTIQCGAYAGPDMASDTIREKDLTGTLDELIEDALAFLKLTMPQTQTLERGIQRKEHYAYPVEALREAIVNAVCHRDYTITGGAIRLLLFNNKLEIRSPGGLPNTLTEENMIYRQFTRNQMIASFLTGYGYMERRGKGMLRMIKSCKENGIACGFSQTPDKNEFVVTYGAA